MINTVALTGRLTRDIDLKYTQAGKAVGNFNLAVNRNFKNANGNVEADFISCTIWGKSAENLANFAHKGTLIGVEGSIQTRNYENKQGQKVYVTEVRVQTFSLLETRNSQNNGYQNQQNNSWGNSQDGINVTDDDLPF
ncbi:single-stranded DNA-binding protein [Fructilactobacillus florum]|uniref:single-stranded DNA-binding protein n=1 Tax=Fructilactobacillus florum TaxID=640331 RepID=UPI00055084E7|nr:single-stranded DNA-binding protein [Fructilactobacillus florum]